MRSHLAAAFLGARYSLPTRRRELFCDSPDSLDPQQRRVQVALLLARGVLRRRALNLGQPAAEPLDSAAKTRLIVVNGAESAPSKRADGGASTPRRLLPQHPSL